MSREDIDAGRASSGLDDREMEVLRSVIRAHIQTGEPVGSSTVSRGARLRLSPASIRGIMAALEQSGWLSQPHTSAGRVPTDRAYRLFVDHMISPPRVAEAQALAIDQALSGARGEVDDLLVEASRQLSVRSNQVGLVLVPDVRRIVVEHVEFVRLDRGKAVAILVGRSGVVHNRTLEVDDLPEQPELDRIGRYLTDEFRGQTLPQIRERLERKLREERAAYDRLVGTGLRLGRKVFDVEGAEFDLFVEGASNLLSWPEFADLDMTRALFKRLEEKRLLIDLLSRILDESGVQVVIGEENRQSDLAQCSLVASTYGSGQGTLGTVGIVGPTRMEYARAIALVDYLARTLTRLLSAP